MSVSASFVLCVLHGVALRNAGNLKASNEPCNHFFPGSEIPQSPPCIITLQNFINFMAASEEIIDIRCVRKSTLTWLFDQGPFQTETDRDKLQREKIRKALLTTCAEERFVYLEHFYKLVQRSTDASTLERERSGLNLMGRALQNVLKYSWNVLRHKDRKEYRTIKVWKIRTVDLRVFFVRGAFFRCITVFTSAMWSLYSVKLALSLKQWDLDLKAPR